MKSLHQTTHGLSDAIVSPGTKGQVRPYSENARPMPRALVVEVIHPGSDWEPAHCGSAMSCEQTYREIVEEMRRPITGVRIRDCKGTVVRQEVPGDAPVPPAPTRKRHKGRPMKRRQGAT